MEGAVSQVGVTQIGPFPFDVGQAGAAQVRAAKHPAGNAAAGEQGFLQIGLDKAGAAQEHVFHVGAA